jgi:hypothetical protein
MEKAVRKESLRAANGKMNPGMIAVKNFLVKVHLSYPTSKENLWTLKRQIR